MVRQFRVTRVRERARHALFDALVSSYEGRYVRAERAARQAFETGDEHGLAALVAARAAHNLNHAALRDEWLARARDAALESGAKPLLNAALLTQAELLSAERRDREALAVLHDLGKGGVRHIAAQRLALRSLTRAGMWDEALKVARQLEEHKAIHPAVMAKTRESAYSALFETTDVALLRERLRRLTRNDRRQAGVVRPAARGLMRVGLHGEARDLIGSALDEAWDDALGALYADCATDDAQALHGQLQRAEGWRTRYPREPGLLVTLGRLCGAAGLWGKAQEYLELALSLQATRAAHVELARVFDATGRADEANRHFRAAASLAV
jgi:HemY protein